MNIINSTFVNIAIVPSHGYPCVSPVPGKPSTDSPVEVTLSCHDQESLDEGGGDGSVDVGWVNLAGLAMIISCTFTSWQFLGDALV